MAQDGRNFWPEFHTAVKALCNLYETQTAKCSCIAMSATFRQSDQDVILNLFGKKPDMVMWLELSCHHIHFDVVITGNPIISVTSALKQDYKYATTMKSIVYSNSKKQAVGTIAKVCKLVLEQNNINGKVLLLTGEDGLKNKVFIMHSFGQEDEEESAARTADEGKKPLPYLLIMPATSAANCGVSSKDCHRFYRVGITPSMYTLVQELGRVDCNPSVEIDDDCYEVHMLFMCVVLLYVRVMQQNDKPERIISLVALHKVLKFLVLPCTCQHVLMKQYFKNSSLLLQKEVCAGYCSFCKKDNNTTGGIVQKEILTNLHIGLFMGNAPTPKGLVKFIKLHKEKRYQSNDVPNKLMGPIHASCLQLIANGMILFFRAERQASNDWKN